MNRDQYLLDIRPTIAISESTHNEVESFQNITLRPILKLQNLIIIAVCIDILIAKHKNYHNYTLADKTKLINKAVKTDHNLKKLLIGITIAIFTQHELNFYLQNKNEINKRIMTLIFKRLLDQLDIVNNE